MFQDSTCKSELTLKNLKIFKRSKKKRIKEIYKMKLPDILKPNKLENIDK